ncbi:MAG: fasciclin domain-containing protein [Bacteroidota bacterium]|nr:fasciclin domain-containing protein [Bacteroidota bacterium]
MRFKKEYFLVIVFFTIITSSCRKWDYHTAINKQDLTQDLYTAISNDLNLRRFSALVTQAGLDSVLKSPRNYTVWAPSNDALAALDPSILNDMTKLRSFILNHISNGLYFTRDAQTVKRIGMLNGKYNNFLGNKFEDATITSADRYVKNGVVHSMDKYISVLPNLWDYINSNTPQYTQNSFITGLNFQSFDPSTAVIDSISSTTGLPIYHPGTGIVIKNTFNERVYDTRKENRQYTYFVIANAGFTLKADSLKPYFNTGSTTSTDSLDKWNIVKDLLIDSLYPTAASLPAALVSKFGITIPINSSLITSTIKVSNGIVYVLSSSNVTTASKFKQIFIQGENPSGFLSDKTSNTSYRVRFNPVTNQNYTDILVSGHGVTSYYSYYQLRDMPSMTYNVYAFAVNDFQTGAVFQKIGVNYFTPPSTYTALATTPASLNHAVPLKTAVGAYNEVLLGTCTSTLYGTLEFRLISEGATLGSTGTGPIVLDYLRIVPVP